MGLFYKAELRARTAGSKDGIREPPKLGDSKEPFRLWLILLRYIFKLKNAGFYNRPKCVLKL